MSNDQKVISRPRTHYRPSIPVTAERRNHCHIYLDEELYISALTLLTDLVTSGASHPESLNIPAYAPVPFHIEIVSALLVHPRHTTQAPPGERVELAWRAVTFLRSLLATLGPLNANLGEAFSLTPPRARGARRGRNIGDGDSSDEGDNDERMGGVVANQGRIRRCAKDFWHIVGWAFNCSVVYPKRWKYWKAWLDYMLDVLEADWEQREAMDKEVDPGQTQSTDDSNMDLPMLQESLLVKYLSDVKGRSSGMKRVVGAVFAAASPDDLRAYPEVFPNETKEVQAQNGQKRKRENSMKSAFVGFDDVDTDEFDYSSSQPDPTADSSQNSADEEVIIDQWMAYPETAVLRQRLLAMLSHLSDTFPEMFINVRELYEIYSVNSKTLPLPAFSLLFSPSTPYALPAKVFVTITRLVLERLSPHAAPACGSAGITQEVLERAVLPSVASTSSPADNARVSILAESLFRLYLKLCEVADTPGLDAAVEAGIRAREAKAKIDRRRKDSSAGEKDREWLVASSRRLRKLVVWASSCQQAEEENKVK